MQTNELRERYLAFFETKGCVRKPSDVLVPRWDPSVLFTPAGMNQFKDHFLGRVKLEYTKATTCQKCLRTGDIDNVGRTAYHHTFFEMLGNFSFGDYFKREAIHWAWEFLTKKTSDSGGGLGIDPAKLSVTVYKDDSEAAKIWFDEIGIPKNRLQYLDEDENFWPASAPSLGPDGVCGPCSEIYHDSPSGPVEIWNLVFMQFNRLGNLGPNGELTNLHPLPNKNIDTGMGLERCAAVLQGVDTNFHIDTLRPLVETAAEVLGIKYEPEQTAAGRPQPAAENARRLRRIADHIRACVFAVHENVYPGNKEEKYVIRRLLRRALLDGYQMGYKDTFLHLLVPKVAELMKSPYPELLDTTTRVAKVIETEEEHFIETLDSGLDKIERIFTAMKKKAASGKQKTAVVSGADIFDMYQTFGFPPELFETMASENGFAFDWDGYKKEMEHHGEISSGNSEKGALFKEDVLAEIKKIHKTEFVGYDVWQVNDAKVIAIVVDGNLVDQVDKPGTEAKIVLDKTPFYGEKGGQVGDTGTFNNLDPGFQVFTTHIDGDLILHVGECRCNSIKVGDSLIACIDRGNRNAVARAHTATHLLHYALRKALGDHAEQQGSKVDADILRFDFTNHQAVDKETLRKVEAEVNHQILCGNDVECAVMSIEEARKSGAIMLFGEKYPEDVRVVQIGESKELCGGTHLESSSQIGLFKIIAEESVASGVRRITALTGMKAFEKAQAESQTVQQLALLLKIPADGVLAKVENLTSQVKQLQKQLKETGGKKQTGDSKQQTAEGLIKKAEVIGGVKLIACELPNVEVNDVRQLIDQIRQKADSVFMLFAVVSDGKTALLAGASRDIADKYSAVDLIRKVTPLIGGKGGGGRPDFAQSGGSDADKLPEVFAEARKYFG